MCKNLCVFEIGLDKPEFNPALSTPDAAEFATAS